jgi:hypothetical protein
MEQLSEGDKNGSEVVLRSFKKWQGLSRDPVGYYQFAPSVALR